MVADKEEIIRYWRLIEDNSTRAVAAHFGLSKSYVSGIITRHLSKKKNYYKPETLNWYERD